MMRAQEVERQRKEGLERIATMQKLEISGHLLPGVDLSAANIHRFLADLGPICEMNIFSGPVVKTPDSYDDETVKRLGGRPPEDVNGSLMWDDSGAQLYVFPDKGNWFTLDIYTCKRFDAQKALEFVYERLHPREDMLFAETNQSLKTPWSRYERPSGNSLTPENTYLLDLDRLFDTDLSDFNQVVEAGKRLETIVLKAVERAWCSDRGKLYIRTKSPIKRFAQRF